MKFTPYNEPTEADHAAVATNHQFAALAMWFDPQKLAAEIVALSHFSNLKKSSTYKFDEVKKWVVNGWNTERILGLTAESLSEDALQSALQWGFPQAYYSVYTLTLACFKTLGHTELSHTSVIKKFGILCEQGKYPASISFHATGNEPMQFVGVGHDGNFSVLTKPNNQHTAEKHIACFLSGTRKHDLKEKKKDLKLKTVTGKNKTHFTDADWQQVSEKLGHTSIVSLLYRKRIKSNYREIDTFLSSKIDGKNLFASLRHIVKCVNLIHEAQIAKAIGKCDYNKLVDSVPSKDFHFAVARHGLIEPLF